MTPASFYSNSNSCPGLPRAATPPAPVAQPAPGALTTTPPVIPPPAAPGSEPTLGEALYGKTSPDSASPPTTPPAAAAAEGKDGTSPAPDAPKEGEAPTDGTTAPKPVALTADSYKDLKVPDGLVLDDALFSEAKGEFAKAGIDPTKAPALLDLYHRALRSQADATISALTAQDTAWRTELQALPEFAGSKFDTARNVIGRAIEEFGSPGVRTVLETYHLGNNPDLARFIYNMAHAMVEGTVPPTGGVPGERNAGRRGRTLGEILYPSSPTN